MSLLTGFNISLDEVGLLGQASRAAFVGGNIPAGWTVVTPAELGLPSKYRAGNYFTDPDSDASAILLKQGNSYVVAFRGTDGQDDLLHYPELLNGSYIHNYDPLLNRLSGLALSGADFTFTGASLGGGATNLMAAIAGSAFGGAFAAATFVAFASPNIRTAQGILNLGFENDPIYKAINDYADFPSSLDNLVLASKQYMAGNYNGRHPFDDYAHSFAFASTTIIQVGKSVFYDLMEPDSVVIVDANNGLVRDVTPGRQNTGAFYLGQNAADSITGRHGNDFLEGFGGNDTLTGAAGNDVLAGGGGNDWLYGGGDRDQIFGGPGQDRLNGGAGRDTFAFNTLAESRGSNRDVIIGFSRAENDHIDLSIIDAETGTGDQAFHLIGDAAFSGAKGELRFAGGVLQGDTNGNGIADFEIKVTGLGAPVNGDFVL